MLKASAIPIAAPGKRQRDEATADELDRLVKRQATEKVRDSRDKTDVDRVCGDHGTWSRLEDLCPGCEEERVATMDWYGYLDILELFGKCGFDFCVEDDVLSDALGKHIVHYCYLATVPRHS